MGRHWWTPLVIGLATWSAVDALGGPQCITTSTTKHALASTSSPAIIIVDSSDWPGVHRAATDLVNDLKKVTGVQPLVVNITISATDEISSDTISQQLGNVDSPSTPILIGTLGRSKIADYAASLNTTALRDLEDIKGKWESTVSQVVDIQGLGNVYTVIGSDKRGTIYGIYDISEQIGVSPWYWWADVPVKKHDALYAAEDANCSHGEPTVKYRGIFLNDEQPGLTNWVIESFSNGTQASRAPFNRFFYSHVFELLLRLRANYLWPTMWNSAFGVDDPLNQYTADLYGIVMGTSHQEPMLRASPPEWSQFGSGPWNWDHNTENLTAFWTDGAERGKNYESIYTVGMRGSGDLPLDESGNIDLLQRIVEAQREILGDVFQKDASEIPQVWCLYKEVQGYYERGMRVPDDVILLWADDNWGNIRRLPTEEERKRPGGAGIYYHFDYVGDPRDYKWGNSHSLSKFHHQLSLAKDYSADKLWIVNVGDLKPHEISIDFFMTYAWNTTRWTKDDLDEYRELWALREFGSEEHASDIADVLERYSRLNSRRKHELINSTTYNLHTYREAEGVLEEWDLIYEKSSSIVEVLGEEYYPAYFELVHHPVKAGRNIQAMYITAGYNQLYASQAKSVINSLADKTWELFQLDEEIREEYHGLLDGKWNRMMDQTAMGYYYWQQPMLNTMPSVTRAQKRQVALAGAMRVGIEGSPGAWPGDNSNQCAMGYNCPPPTLTPLTPFSPLGSRWVEVAAGGPMAFSWNVTTNVTWLTLEPSNGSISDADGVNRIYASVDFDAIPAGTLAVANLNLRASSGQSVTVYLPANHTVVPEDLGFSGFVESEGVISIEAEHATRNTTVDGVGWEVLPGYGKTLSAVTPTVVVDARFAAGQGPTIEYDFYTFNGGNFSVTVYTAPSMNTYPGHPLTYAVSLDDDTPIVVQPMPAFTASGNPPSIWNQFVAEEVVKNTTLHVGKLPGAHTLKIHATEIGVVVEKIVINLGGLQQSYLGPPESLRV